MIPLRALLRRSSPPVTVISIILLNFFCFLTELSRPGRFIAHYALVPDHLHFTNLVTYMFLHAGWLHLIGNMWFLWVFGSHLENALGSGRFLIFYLACGIGAGAVQAFLNLGSPIPTLGASGAIAGVMGAFLIIYPRVRVVTLVFIIIFITTIEIPAAFMLLYWFAIQLISGLMSSGRLLLNGRMVDGGGVAWFAHVGGFLAGILIVKLLPARRFLYDARS
jgi:membrane associated rhomboid family serine protease